MKESIALVAVFTLAAIGLGWIVLEFFEHVIERLP